MVRTEIQRFLGIGTLAAALSMLAPVHLLAQAPAAQAPSVVTVEQPDAHHTRDELSRLLNHYPPNLRNVFAMDHSLLTNQSYLAPYPDLVTYFAAHPEIARDPSFYIGDANSVNHDSRPDTTTPAERIWTHLLEQFAIFAGFAMAIGVLTWLIRTLVDYRRWNKLTKIQTDVHTKLLDRFTDNEELLAYIKSPAGSKFLESSPISLDAGPRSVGAPLGRILWSVQAGLVSIAGGIGMDIVGDRVPSEAGQPIHALGILGIALGLGFVISAGVSFFISQRLGLIEAPPAHRIEPPPTLG
jgi:hypothetical protein